jgi:hypothetical protein
MARTHHPSAMSGSATSFTTGLLDELLAAMV